MKRWIVCLFLLLASCTRSTTPSAITPTRTPDVCATANAHLAVLLPTVQFLEQEYPLLQQTAIALETRCAYTPVPISTPIPTPTVNTCLKCTLGGRECPTGYQCYNCYGTLGWLCVHTNEAGIPVNPNGDCSLCRNQTSTSYQPVPMAIGIATMYEEHVGRAMRNEAPYDPGAMTCAIPHEKWDEWGGTTLIIRRVDGGGEVWVQATDTGLLTEAEQYEWDTYEQNGVIIEWWKKTTTGRWNVVVDLTPRAYAELFKDGHFGLVAIYPEGESQ